MKRNRLLAASPGFAALACAATIVCPPLAGAAQPPAKHIPNGPPDPAASTVMWAGPFPGNCTRPLICPGGDTPAVINITVKDAFFVPQAGDNGYVDGCTLGNLAPCVWGVPAVPWDAPTDAAGFATTTLSAPAHAAGGNCSGLNVWASAVPADILLKILPPYKSFDFNGDGAVTLADLGFFADSYNLCMGQDGYDAAFDYDCSGCVTLSDLGLFATHFGHHC